MTPVMWAAWSGHVDVVKLLLDASANINCINRVSIIVSTFTVLSYFSLSLSLSYCLCLCVSVCLSVCLSVCVVTAIVVVP